MMKLRALTACVLVAALFLAAMPAAAGQTYVLTPAKLLSILDTWPWKDAVAGVSIKGAAPKSMIYLASDGVPGKNSESSNFIAAYWKIDPRNENPQLVIWFHDDERSDDRSGTILQTTVKLYVLPRPDSLYYALVGSKTFSRAISPRGQPIPIFDKNSLFGQWWQWWHEDVGEPDAEIPTIEFSK